MAAVRKILEEIKWGISPEVLAKKHPWENLSNQDPDELLNFARYQRDSQQSYNILVYLFRVSRDKDLWFSVEVLSQALQHPAMSSEDRNTILRTMRTRLDRIKDEVTARQPSEEKIRKYWLLEASYYAIYGSTLAENDRGEEAVQNYQIAEGIFEQLGLTQQAENYHHKIERLSTSGLQPKLPEEKPVSSPPTQSPPLSASFRGTMELVAAGKLPPSQPEAAPPHEPAAPSPSNDLGPVPPAFTLERPSSPESQNQRSLMDVPGIQGTKEDSSEVPSNQPTLIETGEDKPFKASSEIPVENEVPSNSYAEEKVSSEPQTLMPLQDQQLSAIMPDLTGELAAKSQELDGLKKSIEEQSEVLNEIQLEIHMYQERRKLLFREVQSLEKKAAYLKELCDRLERKSDKLEKGT